MATQKSQYNSLDEIGLKYGTDKCPKNHNLLVKYERFFGLKRNVPLKILEIGVANGESILTWSDYFTHPKTKIFGIDIILKPLVFDDKRIRLIEADQDNLDQMESIGKEHGPFDLILDDASHLCGSQIECFRRMIDYVVRGGVYVIEDIFTSYIPRYQTGSRKLKRLNKGTNTIDFLKRVIDNLNYNGVRGKRGWQRAEVHLDPVFKREFDIAGLLFVNNACIIYR